MTDFGRRGSYEGVPTIGRITPITDKDAVIPRDLWDPHYTDTRFTQGTREGLTIFVDPKVTLVPGTVVDEMAADLSYVHSDKAHSWRGGDAMREAVIRAEQEVGNNRSAKFAEHMLRHVFEDDSILLGHLRAGVNISTGYSYHLYGFSTDK